MISVPDIVVEVVSEVTGICQSDIVGSGRSTDIVDARNIAVYYCYRYGVGSRTIAERFGKARYSINRVVTNYYSRRSCQFYLWDDAVAKGLSDRMGVR